MQKNMETVIKYKIFVDSTNPSRMAIVEQYKRGKLPSLPTGASWVNPKVINVKPNGTSPYGDPNVILAAIEKDGYYMV